MKQKKATLDIKQKLKYKALKSSSKKLKKEICKTREEVMTRQENVCKTTQLYAMSESQSLVDGELNESGVRIIRIVSNHSLEENVHHTNTKAGQRDILNVIEIDRQLALQGFTKGEL